VTMLAARADTLAQRWRELRAVAGAIRGAGHQDLPARLDTLSAGPLRVITNPSPLPVRQALGPAWAILDSLFGSALDTMTAHPYFLEATDPDTAVPPPVHPWGLPRSWDIDSATLVRDLATILPVPAPDGALREWLGGTVQPTFRARQDAEAAYVDLVTSPYQIARRCFTGDLTACGSALSLDAGSYRVSRWYLTAEERRRVAMGFAAYFDDAARRPMFRACGAGSDSTCVALLTSMDPATLPKALQGGSRQTVLRLALRLGGHDAWHRLTEDSSQAMGDRIAAAAGIPLDSLLARWQRAILATRPAPLALAPWMIAAGVGWVAAFGLLGLASSRWRLE
ncbi:MAG: hypothetical protein ACREL4_02485, partial [Gemmatimonadales bacterium]